MDFNPFIHFNPFSFVGYEGTIRYRIFFVDSSRIDFQYLTIYWIKYLHIFKDKIQLCKNTFYSKINSKTIFDSNDRNGIFDRLH